MASTDPEKSLAITGGLAALRRRTDPGGGGRAAGHPVGQGAPADRPGGRRRRGQGQHRRRHRRVHRPRGAVSAPASGSSYCEVAPDLGEVGLPLRALGIAGASYPPARDRARRAPGHRPRPRPDPGRRGPAAAAARRQGRALRLAARRPHPQLCRQPLRRDAPARRTDLGAGLCDAGAVLRQLGRRPRGVARAARRARGLRDGGGGQPEARRHRDRGSEGAARLLRDDRARRDRGDRGRRRGRRAARPLLRRGRPDDGDHAHRPDAGGRARQKRGRAQWSRSPAEPRRSQPFPPC